MLISVRRPQELSPRQCSWLTAAECALTALIRMVSFPFHEDVEWGWGPGSSSSAYSAIHADKCVVKATVVREALFFMLPTNGVGAPFVGRDKYECFSYDHAGIALPYLL